MSRERRAIDHRRAERALAERLRGASVPGAEPAEARAWHVVRETAAAESSAPAARGSVLRRLRPAGAALGVAGLAALVVSGAAAAPAEWAIERLDRSAPPAPRVTPLGAPGKLLVLRGDTLVVVRADGTSTRLGRFHGASWSPRGRFVVAWRGTRLAALTARGEVRWSLRAPAPVQAARWSPDGFRIALRTSDGALRIVNGDGTGPRQLARVLGVAFAWRPRAPHTLAWARPDGTLAVRDADTLAAAPVRPAALPAGPVELSFSADGRHLAAWTPGRVRVLDLRRGTATAIGPGRGTVFTGAVFAPRGRRLALARLRRARDGILTVAGQDVHVARGALHGLSWSPDGTVVAASWRSAGQVLAVRVTAPGLASLPGGVPQGWGP